MGEISDCPMICFECRREDMISFVNGSSKILQLPSISQQKFLLKVLFFRKKGKLDEIASSACSGPRANFSQLNLQREKSKRLQSLMDEIQLMVPFLYFPVTLPQLKEQLGDIVLQHEFLSLESLRVHDKAHPFGLKGIINNGTFI
jgi:hypothetical protein